MRITPRLYFALVLLATASEVVCLEWWKTAIVYQIYPMSFKDTDSDGVGDLPGIIEKLDYLEDIGVNAIWMSPIFSSPMADNGYDISDYREINPLFGTMDDFDELLEKAHNKGIKVILDFVPNHTSDEHEWFIASSDPQSENYETYKDFYVWVNAKEDGSPPNKWEVLRYWLDKGVDGFRMDAVACLVEEDGFPDFQEDKPSPMQHQPETYVVIQEFRKVLDNYTDRVMMTEAYGTVEEMLGYYGNETNPGAHFSFNFLLITDLSNTSTAEDFVKVIGNWINVVNENGVWSNWVIGNHDRPRVASRYSPELVDGMNMLVTLLPGTAVTYNGEEIGMEDNYNITCEQANDPGGCADNVTLGASRDPERTPFQWDDSENAGFSNATETWLPVNSNYETLNAAAQNNTEGRSHLKTYRRLAQLRQEDEALHDENATVASSGSVFIFSRSPGDTGTTVVAVNVGNEDQEVDLQETLPDLEGNKFTVYASSVNSGLDEGTEVDGHSVRLAAQQAVVLHAQSAGVLQTGSSSLMLAAAFTLLCMILTQ